MLFIKNNEENFYKIANLLFEFNSDNYSFHSPMEEYESEYKK